MRGCGRTVAAAVVVAVVVVAVVLALALHHRAATPQCEVTGESASGSRVVYTVAPEQASNAATIAAVGLKMGLPAHAATIAIATALQESKLRNLADGDRDSIGLFQQRPSQGWGTPDQLHDPVFAATAFYRKLVALSDWTDLPVTVAAQEVQRSGLPDAYAEWESQARAMAAALNGQFPAALTCRHLDVGAPSVSLVDTAQAELGTTQLSGPHPADEGWATATWLVAHAVELGVDRVGFAGQRWTAKSGSWAADSSAGPDLSLHQVDAAKSD